MYWQNTYGNCQLSCWLQVKKSVHISEIYILYLSRKTCRTGLDFIYLEMTEQWVLSERSHIKFAKKTKQNNAWITLFNIQKGISDVTVQAKLFQKRVITFLLKITKINNCFPLWNNIHWWIFHWPGMHINFMLTCFALTQNTVHCISPVAREGLKKKKTAKRKRNSGEPLVNHTSNRCVSLFVTSLHGC